MSAIRTTGIRGYVDVHNYQLVSYAFAALTALMLIGGLIFAGVTLRRNGRASVLALAACAALLIGQLVYTFGYQAISYSGEGFIAVTAIGGLLHMLGIALLLAAALLPRTPGTPRPTEWGPSQQGPGGWSPQPPDHGGGWNPPAQQVPGQTSPGGWAPQQEQGWSPQGGWGPAAPGGYDPGAPQQGGPGYQPGVAPQSGPPYPQQPQSGPPYQQPHPPQ
ncbi:hypothetical protein [Longispora urticae]